MSKQTAVNLLVSKLNKEGFAPVLTNEEIQEALQMEREQIKSTFRDAQVFEIMEYPITDVQYYEQTYGGQDE
jgi:hypothetical protein